MAIRTALAVLAATAALVVPATPAHAQTCAPTGADTFSRLPVGLTPTEIHWTRITRRTTYGSDAVVQGQVVTTDGAIGDAQVHLWARPSGGAWAYQGTTTSDTESGVFSFCGVLPVSTTAYRVEYHGDVVHAASEATRTVRLTRSLDDAMRRTGDTRFEHVGRVSPDYAGRVLLQHRRGDGAWTTVARRTTDDSRWTFRIDVAGLRGRHAWRAVVPAGGGFERSVGASWRIRLS